MKKTGPLPGNGPVSFVDGEQSLRPRANRQAAGDHVAVFIDIARDVIEIDVGRHNNRDDLWQPLSEW